MTRRPEAGSRRIAVFDRVFREDLRFWIDTNRKLALRCFDLVEATLIDPFTGLGSTAVACARLGLDFVGADLDEAYLAEAVIRARTAVLDEAVGRKRPAKAGSGWELKERRVKSRAEG